MNVSTAEQVIVGKMSLPQVSGQLSWFALPQSFAWLRYFSAEEIAQFLSELLEVLQKSRGSGDWTAVSELLSTWEATAEVIGDATLAQEIDQGLTELDTDQGISWAALQRELNL